MSNFATEIYINNLLVNDQLDAVEDAATILAGVLQMLAGALQGSHAHFRGQTVLIECDKPVFLEMMRSNDFTRQSLKRAIAEVTGVKYGVGPYTAAPKATTPQSSPLEDLIKQAEGMGIPVTRE